MCTLCFEILYLLRAWLSTWSPYSRMHTKRCNLHARAVDENRNAVERCAALSRSRRSVEREHELLRASRILNDTKPSVKKFPLLQSRSVGHENKQRGQCTLGDRNQSLLCRSCMALVSALIVQPVLSSSNPRSSRRPRSHRNWQLCSGPPLTR